MKSLKHYDNLIALLQAQRSTIGAIEELTVNHGNTTGDERIEIATICECNTDIIKAVDNGYIDSTDIYEGRTGELSLFLLLNRQKLTLANLIRTESNHINR